MPGTPEKESRVSTVDNETLRAKVAELKSRLAALHERVTALEEKKLQRDSAAESTRGRS